MRLRSKVLGVSVTGVVITAVVAAAAVMLLKPHFVRQMTGELNVLAQQECQKIAKDAYVMLKVYHETLQARIRNDLGVAQEVLAQHGPVSFSDRATVSWEAINQLTKSRERVVLPQVFLGSTSLGQNDDPKSPSPVVDKVGSLLGGTCTLFQRMNEAGDMLRVCTNVPTVDGKRAVGTYIPVRNPDGTPNPVLSAVLRGETYVGRAFVVDAWCITAYAPIFDANKTVRGVLYVGQREENIPELRRGLMSIVVGKTGYIYVLRGTGEARGQYVISAQGKRDGENIWDAKDADGNPFIQSVIRKALATRNGQCDFERYPWKNVGEDRARYKVAAVTYFEPWDWVIGVGAYEDDFQDSLARIEALFTQLIIWVSIAAGLSAVCCGGLAIAVTGRMLRPLKASIAMLADIAHGQGDLTRRLTVSGNDEIAELGGLFNTFVDKLETTMREVTQSAHQFADGSRVIAESSQTLAQGAQTQSSSVEEMTAAVEELARSIEGVKENAVEADTVAKRTNHLAEQGGKAVEKSVEAMSLIRTSSTQIGEIIQVGR